MEIKFWFTTAEAREHAARAYEAAYSDDHGIRSLELGETLTASGFHADTIGDAINGGPVGGHYDTISE